ncbi:hypothetical protein EZH22_10435 [Xanthobacter dioxanivorans]|uniref:FAD-dependent oxidoreductase n=1 Tax=Xanthobacter dioxanivorans TaxID=2528964 RepID=A0A974PUG8_9HYPH|nr:hypothetical protein [Xanthobacter dioxanivorans]QRG09930.1 hypothetical protein EZH22_10435 [Xanthobacter dioxanivorans]
MIASRSVAIIGAGPVGLAAAAHLLARGLTPLGFERGAGICSAAPVTTGGSGCCGGLAPRDADASCAGDARAEAEGHDGCEAAAPHAETSSCRGTAA